MMKTGLYINVPFEDYRKWGHVSKSMFHYILKSGLHLRHYIDNADDDKPVMVFGNIVDTMLFEPDLLLNRFICAPETYPNTAKGITVHKPWNYSANYCKEWRDLILTETPEIKIVSGGDLLKASKIVDMIKSHPEASQWLLNAEFQVSMSWVDPETGLDSMGRLDALNSERLIDLKITNNPHPSAFSRTMNNFLYHAQAAFYHDGYFACRGMEIPETIQIPFSFIVAEDSEPFDVVCYNIGQDSFEAGRIVYREALARYKEMMDSGEYYGYSNVAEEIDIPRYALNKIQMEGIIE